MANITRFDPFTDLARFNPFHGVGDLFHGLRLRPTLGDLTVEPEIKLDVLDEDKAYVVKAEVPGVKKDDIAVTLDGNQVSITAELKREKEEKEGKNLIRSERYFGKQFRSFSLGSEIDESKAEAEYKDGLLTLTLPKKSNGKEKHTKLAIK